MSSWRMRSFWTPEGAMTIWSPTDRTLIPPPVPETQPCATRCMEQIMTWKKVRIAWNFNFLWEKNALSNPKKLQAIYCVMLFLHRGCMYAHVEQHRMQLKYIHEYLKLWIIEAVRATFWTVDGILVKMPYTQKAGDICTPAHRYMHYKIFDTKSSLNLNVGRSRPDYQEDGYVQGAMSTFLSNLTSIPRKNILGRTNKNFILFQGFSLKSGPYCSVRYAVRHVLEAT